MSQTSFIQAWCATRETAPATFAEEVFQETLYPHTKKFVALIRWVAPRYFDPDMEMINRVGEATSMVELVRQANSYGFFQREDGYCRRVLRLRVSGRRLAQLAEIVMQPERLQQLHLNRFHAPADSLTIGIGIAARVSMGDSLVSEMSMPGADSVTVNSTGRNKVATKTDTTVRCAYTFQESWMRIQGQRRDYFEGVFYRALYPHARWFARLIRCFYRDYFAADFEAIRSIGATKTVQEMCHELECYRYQHPERGMLRRTLKLRISGERLVSMAAFVLPRE